MSDMMRDITSIAMAVIGLAMLAVVIKSPHTVGIFGSVFGGSSKLIGAAAQG